MNQYILKWMAHYLNESSHSICFLSIADVAQMCNMFRQRFFGPPAERDEHPAEGMFQTRSGTARLVYKKFP
ncbi:hypothetical protein D3Z50_14525 [Clostridiaceae bacterium]|nr:hypothetical protein [Clostridiaceae bacterium]